MEENQKTSQKRNYLIAGLVVVLVIGFFLFTRQKAKAPENSEEQTDSQNTNSDQDVSENGSDTSQNTNDSTPASQPTPPAETPSGNVSAKGTLRASDNSSLGNLMLDSNRGKIYVKTNRDYSGLVGKDATLSAQGTLNSFVFLGFKEGGASGTVAGTSTTDTSAVGGGDTKPGAVSSSGTLAASDNQVRGNYVINSSAGKIYFRSQHDYSSWVGSEVQLAATGTINSFTGASLTKK